tara:strand:- start:246 stop:428 length:183 start_codon:yes stop_codon:yes gene_type:complete
MKLYTKNEIQTAVLLVSDNIEQCKEVVSILERINEDSKFANDLGLNQSLHLKSVLLDNRK